MANHEAQRDYRVFANDCKQLLEEIAAELATHEADAHAAKNGLHYGHCGDLQHAREQLRAIKHFIGGTED